MRALKMTLSVAPVLFILLLPLTIVDALTNEGETQTEPVVETESLVDMVNRDKCLNLGRVAPPWQLAAAERHCERIRKKYMEIPEEQRPDCPDPYTSQCRGIPGTGFAFPKRDCALRCRIPDPVYDKRKWIQITELVPHAKLERQNANVHQVLEGPPPQGSGELETKEPIEGGDVGKTSSKKKKGLKIRFPKLSCKNFRIRLPKKTGSAVANLPEGAVTGATSPGQKNS